MPYTVGTPPSVEPVTLAELKLYARITETAEDALLTELISAARAQVERETRRPLINQTLLATFGCWEELEELGFPFGNTQTLSAVKYYDAANVEQTLAAANYTLISAWTPARLEFISSFSAPELYERPDAIKATVVAGYGAAGTDVPAMLRVAIKALASYWYEQRLPVNVGNIVNVMPLHVTSILKLYRLIVSEPSCRYR